MTTRIFPGLENDDLALPLAGKRNRLSSGDFVRAGVTMGIDAAAARESVESLCGRLSAHLEGIDPASDRVNRAIGVWKERIETTIDRRERRSDARYGEARPSAAAPRARTRSRWNRNRPLRTMISEPATVGPAGSAPKMT